MSESTQTQDIDERYTNHVPTNGPFAKYLWFENPNVPVSQLVDRFKEAQNKADPRADNPIAQGTRSLSRIRTNFPCPDCGSSHVFYTDKINVAACDSCGLRIAETDKTADEILEGR